MLTSVEVSYPVVFLDQRLMRTYSRSSLSHVYIAMSCMYGMPISIGSRSSTTDYVRTLLYPYIELMNEFIYTAQ